MASSVQPSTAPAVKESMSHRLSLAAKVIMTNGWAAQHQLDHAIAKALGGTHDHIGVGRFLVDLQVISRDQASELEEVLKNQVHFPTYMLHRKIGSGGMGTVFLATHLTSERQVALKTMNARLEDDKDFIGRFHREAKALGRVKHPNIAEIIDSGDSKGHCWLAMEFIDGPSLMSLLKDYRVLPETYALRIIRQVAEGLGHVWNSAHLVHRDLKPENILVIRNRGGGGDLFPADDVAKLIDFGLVKGEDKDDRLTQTGMTIGTPLYMSPEQVRGEVLDCRSDVYGLGATLYHLLTGFTPFTGTSPGSIMSAHLTEPVPDPGDRVPSLSKETRELVIMSMAKDAKSRFLTFEGMVKAIDQALEQCGSKGGGTLRLLRKPLVLNKPQKKPASDRVAKTSNDPITGSTGREEAGQGSASSRPTTSRTKGPAASPEPEPISGSAALTRPATDRVINQGQAPIQPSSQAGTKSTTSNRVERSKVFDEDPHAKLGIGILPWVVLGFAIVGLVLWFLLSS
jgi:serine/threonine protein kinase